MLGRPHASSLAATVFVAMGAACSPSVGVVELAWEIVDRDGEKIFPAGAFSLGTRDSCDLPGHLGGVEVPYDLRIELVICDTECPGGCDDEACAVVDPLRFSCEVSRGSNPNIPVADHPYRFNLRTVIVADQQGIVCEDPLPSCIAVPGPRDRQLEPGLVIDLQVYQVAVDVDLATDLIEERTLDLVGCGCA